MTNSNRQTLRAALEAELEPVRLSEARRTAILAAAERVRTQKRHRPLRACLAAAALCAVLALTALAVAPDLREALSQALGSFASYAQEVEGVSATDQGITLRVVRALADENGGTVYLEAEDLTGGRLDDTCRLDQAQCLAYDSQRRTALFAENFNALDLARGLVNEQGEAELSFSTLVPGIRDIGAVNLPWEQVTGEKLETLTLSASECQWWNIVPRAESAVLEPEQTPAALDTELFSLSALGFDEAGSFHIQLRMADGIEVGDYGELYPSYPAMDWTPAQSGQELHTAFRRNGAYYYDICLTELTADHFGHFRIDAICGRVSEAPISGDWKLTFPLELLPSRAIVLAEQLNGQQINRITISATSVKKEALFSDTDRKTVLGYQLSLYLDDGRVVTAPYEDSGRTWTKTGECIVWHLPRAVDPEAVVGIAIGRRYLPVNPDNSAGPGMWLDTLPEQSDN